MIFLTPQQVADALQVHIETVYDMVRAGRLAARRIGATGRSIRIPASALDALEPVRVVPLGRPAGAVVGCLATAQPLLTEVRRSRVSSAGCPGATHRSTERAFSKRDR